MKQSAVRTRKRSAVAILLAIALAGLGVSVGSSAAQAVTPDVLTGTILGYNHTGAIGLALTLTGPGGPFQATTDVAGGYEFDGLADGTYTVSFGGNTDYVAATLPSISVSGATTAAPDFTINYVAGSIAGAFTNYDGSSDISVQAGLWDSGQQQFFDIGAPAPVLADGSWIVHGVQATGKYDLYFTVNDFATPLLSSFYGTGQNEPDGTGVGAGVISAIAHQSVLHLSATLPIAGFVTGTVKYKGTALSGINVDAWDPNLQFDYPAEAPTDSHGIYQLKVPADTPLEIETDGVAPYEYQVYNGHNGCDCTYNSVQIGAGLTQSGINFSLIHTSTPTDLLTIVVTDDGNGGAEPATGYSVHLYKRSGSSYQPIAHQTVDSSATAEFLVHSGGDFEFRISHTNQTTHKTSWFPIEAYILNDPNSDANPVLVTPPSPICTMPLPGVANGAQQLLLMEIAGADSKCARPAPPAATSGTHHSSVTASSPVTTPTPTPTPTPTDTPTPAPTATSTPSGTPTTGIGLAPASSSLPIWVWLLIVLGLLVLVGMGIVIFRVRG